MKKYLILALSLLALSGFAQDSLMVESINKDSLLLETAQTVDSLKSVIEAAFNEYKGNTPSSPSGWVNFIFIAIGGVVTMLFSRAARVVASIKTLFSNMSMEHIVGLIAFIISLGYEIFNNGWAFSIERAVIEMAAMNVVAVIIYNLLTAVGIIKKSPGREEIKSEIPIEKA